MGLVYNIPLFSILLVVVSGVCIPLFRNGRHVIRFIQIVQCMVGVGSLFLMVELSTLNESFTYQLGHVPAPWGNELRAGPLEGLLAFVFSLVMVLTFSGSREDLIADIKPHRLGNYCLLMQLLYGALLAMIYTDDLFTAYVFVEVAAVTACVVVSAKESGRSIVSAIRYLMFNCLGSGLFLLGIAILYALTGHLLFSSLQQAVEQYLLSGSSKLPLIVSALLMTLGLSIKSAQFPFHAWLPDAHASATTTSSAILSGLLLKGYLIILMKLMVRVFGPFVMVSSYLCDLLLLLGLAGMLFASVAALRQEEVKRMIAYSSSAQISYIFLSLGLGSQLGLLAACFQIIVHALTKSMIFLGAGAMINGVHGHYWGQLRGAARKVPVGGIAFTVGGLSLCGIPLLAGFSSKYCIALAALDSDWQMAPALFGLVASSVLNAMYYIPAILVIWGRTKPNQEEEWNPISIGWEQKLALGFLLFCNLYLGMRFGLVRNLIEQGINLLGSFG